MIIELQSGDRWEAIDELIDHLVVEGKIASENRETIIAAVKKRETAMSTGIGFGIAIPHASTDLVSDLVQVVGRSKKGVDFASLDCKPVHKVILFLVPQCEFHKHAHTLANIAKLLHSADFRKGLE